jgi:tripartite-type tricarboxylate transporter receptor subunit TctC
LLSATEKHSFLAHRVQIHSTLHPQTMKMSRVETKSRRVVWSLLLTIALSALLASVKSQSALARWPDRPVRLVLPYGPGGVADVPARILAEKLSEDLGQRFFVENMPGPGGISAARAVLSSAPDGYTLGFVTNGNAIGPVMFKNLPYDPIQQFKMVSQVGEFTLALAVNASSPYKSIEDVISFAHTHPGKLNVGTVSIGSTQNFSAELLKSMANLDFQIIPFKNSPDVAVALIRNDVDVMIDFPASLDSQVEQGTLRYVAVTSMQRSPFLPNVPTVNESGVAGYETNSWNGIFVPTNTPPEIVEAVHDAVTKALSSPDVIASFKQIRIVAQGSSPDQLRSRLKADIEKWEAVRLKAGIPKN